MFNKKCFTVVVVLFLFVQSSFSAVGPFARVGSYQFGLREIPKIGVIDSEHGSAIYVTNSIPAQLVKVRLSDMTRVGTITLDSTDGTVTTALIDPSPSTYAYFGTKAPSGRTAKIIRVRLDDFARAGELPLNTNETDVESAVMDTDGTIYLSVVYTTLNPPRHFVKVSTQPNFARVTTINAYNFYRTTHAMLDKVNNYLLFLEQAPSSSIIRVSLTNFRPASTITPVQVAGGPYRTGFVDNVNGQVYVATYASPSKVYRLRSSNLVRAATLDLPEGDNFIQSSAFDPTRNLAYFGAGGPDETGKVITITVNSNNFTRVGANSFNSSERSVFSSLIDIPNNKGYFGIESEPKIVEVQLSPFTRGASFLFGSGETVSTGVIDRNQGFAYMATTNGKIKKILVSDMTLAGELAPNAGGFASAHVIDEAKGFAYFGTLTTPGKILKVRLSDFSVTQTLTLNAGENNLQTAVLDHSKGMAYFGAATSPATIVKIRLSDFTRQGAVTLAPGENLASPVLVDELRSILYCLTPETPQRIIRVNLQNFARLDSLSFDSSLGSFTSYAIDPSPFYDYAYFGTSTSPGKIVRLNLITFQQDGILNLNSGENWVGSLVVDTIRSRVYAGCAASIGTEKIIQIQRAGFSRIGDALLNPGETPSRLPLPDLNNGMVYFPAGNALVKFQIGFPNRPPQTAPDQFVIQENRPVDFRVLDNDSDPDSEDLLTVTNFTQPTQGTLELQTPTRIGYFEYTPYEGFTGQDSFQYLVSDGRGEEAWETVTIYVGQDPGGVNRAPLVQNPTIKTLVNQPTTLTLPATDPDGNTLTYFYDDPDIGNLVYSPPDAGPNIGYRPPLDFQGAAHFEFYVYDGMVFSKVGTVTVNVTTSLVSTVVIEDGVLKVNGSPYFVKGVAFTADKVGESPDVGNLRDWMILDDNGNGKIDVAYDSYVDANRNGIKDANEPVVGDFQLLKEMGANTIRVYHHASNDPSVRAGYGTFSGTFLQYNHPPNKTLLRDLYRTYGIRVAMGDFLGAYTIGSGSIYPNPTDYNNQVHKDRMKASIRQMVTDFKDEEFLLMYILGNENNYSFTTTNAGQYPVAYARFVEEVTQIIHQMDPNHPVAICMGDVWELATLNQYAPSVDIYGSNAYRGGSFGGLWGQVKAGYNKPVLITEYGDLYPDVSGSPLQLDEVRQRDIFEAAWLDIDANALGKNGQDNSIGGFAFSWMDQWWQNQSPSTHNLGNGGVNNEWHGMFGQASQNTSPYLRQLRQVYTKLKSLWTAAFQLAAAGRIQQADQEPLAFVPTDQYPRQGRIVQPGSDQELDKPKNEGRIFTSERGPRSKNVVNRANGQLANIAFESSGKAPLKMQVIDRSGSTVRSLTISDRGAGIYSEEWDGKDDHGNEVASGTYLALIFEGDTVISRITLVVIR